MNYIVLDLEYNQPISEQYGIGKNKAKFRLVNEIIEIGAVKLDNNLKFNKGFKCYIRPYYQKPVHPRILKLLDITEEELQINGTSFQHAARLFKDFVGEEDFCFITWAGEDISVLKMNYHAYKFTPEWFEKKKRYDIQKLYMIHNDLKDSISLENAIKELAITVDDSFHRAYNDALYTSKILQTMGKEKLVTLNNTLKNSKRFVNEDKIPKKINELLKQRLHCKCGRFVKKIAYIKPYYHINQPEIRFSVLGHCKTCDNCIDNKYIYNTKSKTIQVQKPIVYRHTNKNSREFIKKTYGKEIQKQYCDGTKKQSE